MSNNLEELLSEIQTIMLGNMKEDLQDPEKRSPQLYNAVIKELERNGINCLPKAGEDGKNALQELLDSVIDNYEENTKEAPVEPVKPSQSYLRVN